MNKTEILAEIDSKYDAMDASPTLVVEDSPTGYNLYTIKVLDLANTTLISDNVQFYVYHEGEEDEAAYYFMEEPNPHDFFADLQDFIDAAILAEDVEGLFIENYDEINDTAVLRVVKNDLTEAKHFIDRDGNGDIRNRTIGS